MGRPLTECHVVDVTANTDSQAADTPLEVFGRVVSAPAAEFCPPHSPNEGLALPDQDENLPKTRQFVINGLIILTNFVQFTSMFSTLAGGLEFSARLGSEATPGKANWMGAGFSLTQSAMVLISGRLGAIYGHNRCLLIGGSLIVIFSLANAFTTTYGSFVAMRAMTGVGGGILMPNAVASLMITTPPGPARNATLAIFAASPPIGALLGALLAGVFLQETEWKWLFITIAMLEFTVLAVLFFILPREKPVDKDGKVDFVGILLGVSGLVLFSFAWVQGPAVGWDTAYIIATLVLSVVCLGGFYVWERSYAVEPLMPLRIFSAPTFSALIVVVLLTYMSVGIALWYMVAWQQLIRHWTVLELAVGWIPYSVGASLAVSLAAWLIPRLAAQYMLAIGVFASLASLLLLATMPEQQTYWAQTFPAIFIGSICADFVYVAAQIIASNSVGKHEQGIAGSLIGTLNLYGNSLGLGFAGTLEIQLVKDGASESLSYRAALFFGAGLTVAALVVNFAFVRVPRDKNTGEEEEP
ncbi:major facilitator superfamily domain-containing protein [Thelonectria olida]|uniref:Major facilitator superfamily domain-containing protein n=1 Tax=Thelonectria olida TaxID=1576542 RepID=A0A9P9AWP7_9HYPO|nr:major facilitator superfamily domain-containing protein [Thelonectria olida]